MEKETWDKYLFGIKNQLLDYINTLIEFLRNPILGMKNLPQWDWSTLLILQAILAAICGTLSGIISQSLLNFLLGPILFPLSTLIMIAIFSGIFYYSFLFFLNRTIHFKDIYLHLVFANIPLTLLMIIEPLVPPVALVGVAVSSILLTVGFIENFKLPRKPILRLMAALFIIYLFMWILGSIQSYRSQSELRDRSMPESLDILEREFRGNKNQ